MLIEKELQPVGLLRTAAWIWIGYLLAQLGIDFIIYTGRFSPPVMGYHIFNFLPALLFLGLAYTIRPTQRTGWITGLMIAILSIAPIMINHALGLKLPPAPLSNIEGMAIRQLPIFIIGLVLVAWHYRLPAILLYAVSISILETLIVFSINRIPPQKLSAFLFIILVRMVCFIVVGIFINQLIHSLRAQQKSLKTANEQLSHYASMLETLTITRERNRMSRELHDTVVHTLSGLSVQLETARAYLDLQPETTRTLLDQSLETARSGLQETRRALKALRATPLEDLGLLLALRRLVEHAAQRGKLEPDMDLPSDLPALPPDIEQCIFRIAQEAVENVTHHANATRIRLKLSSLQDELSLLVEDNGMGFDVQHSSPSGHFGLSGMQERAALIGGTLTIHSTPQQGTSIRLLIQGIQS